jgi:hypothetical protein
VNSRSLMFRPRLRFGDNFIHRLVVGVDSPLLHQAVLHHSHPGGRRPLFVLRRKLSIFRDGAARRAKHSYDSSIFQYFLVRNPVVRAK